MPRVVSLYCGAGGIDLGLAWAGLKTALAIDADADACATMRAAHPDAEVMHCSVADAQASIGRADVVVGGPPCPEFSIAKAGRTLDDTEVRRFWQVVGDARAGHWLMENVRGVAAVLPGRTDGKVVDCADYGVAQNRIRMIYSSWPRPRATHARRGPYTTLDCRAVEKWIPYGAALGIDAVLENRQRNEIRRYGKDRPAPTVIVSERFWLTSDRLAAHAGRPLKEKNAPRTLNRPASTITARDRNLGNDIMSDSRWERKFTLRELAALQGFPADYPFCGNATSQRRQIGNALPPQVARAFAAGGMRLGV